MGRPKKYKTEEEKIAAKREAQKRYREKNPEEKKARNREKQKRYRERHKNDKEFKDKQAARKARQAEYQATPFGRATHLVGAYSKKDKKYNRGECTIDAKWIVDNVFSGQVCHYCGESDWHLLGCDRIDNTLPHTPENCVPCCGSCNNKKHTTPYDEFMRMIGKIV